MSDPFSNSHKTIVFSQAAHLWAVDEFADANAVMYALLQNQPITDAIVNSYLGGVGVKVDTARGWARDNYVLGMPNNHHSTANRIVDSVVADTITEDRSLLYGCLIRYNFIGYMNPSIIALPFLLGSREYSTADNTISILPAGWSIRTSYKQDTALARTVTVSSVELTTDNTGVTITYLAELHYRKYVYAPEGQGEWETFQVPSEDFTSTFSEVVTVDSGFRMGKLYLIAGYSKLDSEGAAGDLVNWWYYALGTNKYPQLDPSMGTADQINSYPVIPIRYKNQYISPTNSPEVYTTGSQLLRRMDMSFDVLVDQLDSNPDIADIDHAYVMFGADLQTDEDTTLGYLAQFFTYLADSDDSTLWDALVTDTSDRVNYFSSGSKVNNGQATDSSFLGADLSDNTVVNPEDFLSLTEYGLDVSITYKRITSVLVNGSIGPVGTANKTITEGPGGTTYAAVFETNTILIIRWQVATNVYREVTVTGLVHHNDIYKNHGVYTTPLDVLDDPDNHNLIIPLHFTVVQQLDIRQKNTLYQDCTLLVLNGYDRIKVKWYQTSFFQAVITIVGFAIAISTGQAWVLAFTTAATAGVGALLLFLFQTVVISAALHYATLELAKKIGPELAMLVALVAMAFGARIKGTFKFLGTEIPTAEALLMAGSSLMSSSNEAMQLLIEDVAGEAEDYAVDAEAQMEILKAKADLLSPEYLLPFSYLETPYNHATPDTITPPERFFDSIHLGNVGTFSLDVIQNYVTMALILPKVGEV